MLGHDILLVSPEWGPSEVLLRCCPCAHGLESSRRTLLVLHQTWVWLLVPDVWREGQHLRPDICLEEKMAICSFKCTRVDWTWPDSSGMIHSVLIHQAWSGMQLSSHLPKQKLLVVQFTWIPTHQLLDTSSQLPGLAKRGRDRAPKKKYKHAKRLVLHVQSFP